jgi:hypothetical protein
MSALPFTWDGECFAPLPAFARRADKMFVIGETYMMAEHQERSAATHAHYFAVIREAWLNLPEEQADRFVSPEALRKFCLIKAGYADNRQIVASSRAEAIRLAAFIRPMDEYALVSVEGSVVNVFSAQSQSQRAMGKQRFQASKEAVLDVLASMVGVKTEQLEREAGRAA